MSRWAPFRDLEVRALEQAVLRQLHDPTLADHLRPTHDLWPALAAELDAELRHRFPPGTEPKPWEAS